MVYMAAFLGLYVLARVYAEGVINFLNTFTARSVQIVTNLLGLNVSAVSSHLTVKDFSIQIIVECTGLFALFVFLACVLAYPASPAKKAVGVSTGMVAIYFLNLIRLIFLILIGLWAPDYFDFVHVYLWEVFFIIVVIVLWMLWLTKVVKSVR